MYDYIYIYIQLINGFCNLNICSYCSNYYSEFVELIEICDWCQSDDKKLSSVVKKGGFFVFFF